MKWFALVIFLSAAAAGAYVLTQGGSRPEKQAKETIIQDLPHEEDEEEPRAEAKPEGVDEVIRPPSEPKIAEDGPEGTKRAGDESKDRESRKRKKKGPGAPEESAGANEASPPADKHTPSPRPQIPQPAVASPSPSVPAEPTKPEAASPPGGTGLGNTPIMGGVLTPSGGTSSAGSKPPSSGASRSRTANAAPSGPATRDGDATKPTPTEAKKPSPKEPEKEAHAPKDEAKEKVADKASAENANDFVGLLVSPRSVSVSTPAGSSTAGVPGVTEPEKKMIAVYSMKSGFGPQDKLTIEIFRDCETPLAASCEVTGHEGGPSVAAYLLGTSLSREDLAPDSKTFEVGTTIIGTYQESETGRELALAEIAVQIEPGKVPGHYVVRVRNANEKSFLGSFEVTPPTSLGDTPPQPASVKASAASGAKTVP